MTQIEADKLNDWAWKNLGLMGKQRIDFDLFVQSMVDEPEQIEAGTDDSNPKLELPQGIRMNDERCPNCNTLKICPAKVLFFDRQGNQRPEMRSVDGFWCFKCEIFSNYHDVLEAPNEIYLQKE